MGLGVQLHGDQGVREEDTLQEFRGRVPVRKGGAKERKRHGRAAMAAAHWSLYAMGRRPPTEPGEEASGDSPGSRLSENELLKAQTGLCRGSPAGTHTHRGTHTHTLLLFLHLRTMEAQRIALVSARYEKWGK